MQGSQHTLFFQKWSSLGCLLGVYVDESHHASPIACWRNSGHLHLQCSLIGMPNILPHGKLNEFDSIACCSRLYETLNTQKNRCVPCKLLRQVRKLFRTAGRPRWVKLRLLAGESFLLSVCKSHACATRHHFVSVDNDPESGTEITTNIHSETTIDILQVHNPVYLLI